MRLNRNSLPKKEFPLSKVYGLLEPGPVVLLSTKYKGRSNIMAMSWHMMLEFEPPLMACVVSDRDFSFRALKATKECVINIPTQKIIGKVVSCGNTTGSKTDKFEAFKLTQKMASKVKAPLIAECYANLECRVVDTSMVAKYCIFVLEVVKAWIDPKVKNPKTIHHRGAGSFMIAGRVVKLHSRMK